MVRGSRISKKELRDYDTEEKEAVLRSEFDLTDEDLEEVRSQRYVIDKIRKGAEKLQENGFSQQITPYNISALVYEDWSNPSSKKSSAIQALRNQYREERDAIENVKDLDISYIHLLRDDVGAYSGNILEARTHYDNFSNSHEDLLRSIELPTEFKEDESRLLGAYWADGHFTEDSGRDEFKLTGTADDEEWYNEIRQELDDIHNLDAKVITAKQKKGLTRAEGSETYECERHRISIGSKAVVTWLKNDLNMYEEDSISIPDIDWNPENKAGFLSGALAGMGHITSFGNYEFSTSDEYKADLMTEFAEDIGLQPSISEIEPSERTTRQYRFRLPKDQTVELNKNNFFWNPRHAKQITASERGLEPQDIKNAKTQKEMQKQLLSAAAERGKTPTLQEFEEDSDFNKNDIYEHWEDFSDLARQSDLLPNSSSIGDKLEIYHLLRNDIERVPTVTEAKRVPSLRNFGEGHTPKFSSFIQKAGDMSPKRAGSHNPRDHQNEMLEKNRRLITERIAEEKGKDPEELTYKY